MLVSWDLRPDQVFQVIGWSVCPRRVAGDYPRFEICQHSVSWGKLVWDVYVICGRVCVLRVVVRVGVVCRYAHCIVIDVNVVVG